MTQEKIEKSKQDTLKHIDEVRNAIQAAIKELECRAKYHDQSKLEEPELSIFAEYGPRLKETTYGSDEYKNNLKEMNKALQHHYENNTHHPEYYENGVSGMDIFDVIEMLCDWVAACKRHDDGDVMRSLEINKNRFNLDNQLYQIFKNTFERNILE
ncbi:DUF5662 family protein [Oceanobacillus profundus]|uniref:Uncharacterized protein n=1 Tax=Oceanobacillus profundus TaxID=372463 RepID=A0A417YGM6_9BACI|nr:DUF5662 family protein [Oceanobacillus profundus]RHW31967.1 hypothetical protein D1B32_12065 [Oceanobacillus profundus]